MSINCTASICQTTQNNLRQINGIITKWGIRCKTLIFKGQLKKSNSCKETTRDTKLNYHEVDSIVLQYEYLKKK